MLRNDLCDYNDAYLVVSGKVNADFIGDSNYNNAHTNGDINNNVFPNALFPENLFPLNIFDGADDAAKSAARTAAHANLINVARNAAKTSAVNKAYIEKYKQNLFSFKNNAPFINCTLKINSTIIDNAEDLDVVMPIYNILEYSKNYQKTTGIFWNYYRNETDDDHVVINRQTTSKSFLSKTINAFPYTDCGFVVPLKYLSNFLRTLDFPLTNCELELILKWNSKCFVKSDILRVFDNRVRILKSEIRSQTDMTIEIDYEPTFNFLPNDARFELRDVELYVPVVILSKNNELKLYENFKNGLSREIAWNKYLSKASKENNNTDLNYLVDPTFINFNRIFVLGN